MRNIKRFFLVCVCIAVTVFLLTDFSSGTHMHSVAAKRADITIDHPDKEPVVQLLQSNDETISFTAEFFGFSEEPVLYDGKEFSRIAIENCFKLDTPGLPELPYMKKFVAIPACEDVRLESVVIKEDKIENILIYPAPRIEKEPNPDDCSTRLKEVFEQNSEAYSKDEDFPKEVARIERIFKIRNQHVAELHIFPLQYNASQNTAIFSKEMEVRLIYEFPSGPFCVPTGPFERVCEKIIMNYESLSAPINRAHERMILGGGPGSVDSCTSLSGCVQNNTDYLMIVGHNLWLNSAVRSKIWDLGVKRAEFNRYNVSIIDIDYIVDVELSNADSLLKEELLDFYDQNQAGHMGDGKLGFILLIGDAYICEYHDCEPGYRETIIPAHYRAYGDLEVASDIYYASMDNEDDWFPDVFIGRISVDDSLEAVSCLDKIIPYEPHDISNTWHKKALFVGGDWDEEDLQEMGQEMRNATPAGFTFSDIYRGSSTPNNYSLEIADSIDSGQLFVCEFGHGVEYYWSNTFFPAHYEDSTLMYNEDQYPVIFSFSCLTGRFDTPCYHPPYPPCCHPNVNGVCYSPGAPAEVDSFDCMGERIMNLRNRGALAFIGYTGESYPGSPPTYYESFFDPRFASLGEIATANYYLLGSTNQKMYAVLGDPALNPFYEEDTSSPSDSVDLCVDPYDLEFIPDIFDQEGTKTLGVTIKNIGFVDAEDIDIIVEEDETTIGSGYINTLSAYEDSSVHIDLDLTEVGNHAITITVNPNHTIEELRYDNNSVDTAVAVVNIKTGFPITLNQPNYLYAPPKAANFSPDVYDELLVNDGYQVKLFSCAGESLASTVNTGMPMEYAIPVGNIRQNAHDVLSIARSWLWIKIVLLDLPNLQSVAQTTIDTDLYQYIAKVFAHLYDLDQDGDCEIVYSEGCSYATNNRGLFKIFEYDDGGNDFDEAASLDLDYCPLKVAVEDVTYDNKAEIIVLGIQSVLAPPYHSTLIIKVYNYDTSLSTVKTWTFELSTLYSMVSALDGSLSIFDMNGDAYQDVVASFGDWYVILEGGASAALDTMCTYYSEPEGVGGGAKNYSTPVDIDSDGDVEIVTFTDAKLRILTCSNEELALTDSLELGEDIIVNTRPLISDIDGDGDQEIIVGFSKSETIQYYPDCISGCTSSYFSFYVYDSNLDEESGWVAFNLYGVDNANFTIDDLDKDGKQDVILQTESYLYAFDIPWASSGEKHWTMENGNVHNTNLLSRYVRGTYDDDLSLWGEVDVIGDVTVDSTLYVDAGTMIMVSDDDIDEAGSDTARCEVNLNGDGILLGWEYAEIEIGSAADNPSNTDWLGLSFNTGSSEQNLKYVTITDAELAFKSNGVVSLDTCVIDSTNYETVEFHNNTSINGGIYHLMSDTRIESGDSLSVTGGAEFYASTEDHDNFITDANRVVFEIQGCLDVTGTSENPVKFKSLAAEPQAGDWYGLSFTGTSASGSLSYCNVVRALYGIKSQTTLEMSDCNVKYCQSAGVHLYESGGTTNSSELDNCNISYNSSSGAYGIHIDKCQGTVVVDSCIVNNNYYGLYIGDSSPEISYTQIKNNDKDGVRILDAPLIIYTAEPEIDHCYIENNDESGIYYNNGSGTVSSTRISGNGINGIYCTGSSACPEIDHSKIRSNGYVGVRIANNALPILGNVVTGEGQQNSIYDQPTYVYGSSSDTVKAENCWWGTSPGTLPNPKKFKGIVDFYPCLESDPVPYLAPPIRIETVALSLAQNYPNPFRAGNATTIKYSIPEQSDQVVLKIFDVTGRKIRTLVNGLKTKGEHYTNWDGRNDEGAPVASGIYFCRLIMGNRSLTKKMVVFR